MKKSISVLLFGSILSAITVSNVSAQLFSSSLTSSNASPSATSAEAKKSATGYITKADYKAAKASMKASKANIKAAVNFNKEFKEAPDPKWLIEDKVITARFYQNDIQTRVLYDKKGHWLYTMLTYKEDKLPMNVARLVRDNYRSYDITQVQDIREGSNQFYVVHLEDQKGYKQVCVYDGEISMISEFNK